MLKKCMAISVLLIFVLAGCELQKTAYVKQEYVGTTSSNAPIYKVCVDGYVFAMCRDHGISIAQIWENSAAGPRPMMCKE